MKQTFVKKFKSFVCLTVFAVILGWAGFSEAAGGIFSFTDMEKPKPEFTRNHDMIAAKYIPRAKSTSVMVYFKVVEGGRLIEVKSVDFQDVDRPEVDIKNFKSAAFDIRIKTDFPGGEARASISSDFFTSATEFYVFNSNQSAPWIKDADVVNISHPERVQELVVTVRDGGPLDADGMMNGSISLIGGPRDSFWGYALGTLFIRFFGIFIVLTFLMIGMMLSGVAFRYLESRESREDKGNKRTAAPTPIKIVPTNGADITEAEVAAIAAALHLRFRSSRTSTTAEATSGDSWTSEGRTRIMNDRLNIFKKFNR